MRIREWQSKGWFRSRNIVVAILNAKFTTTNTINICSSCRYHIISHWNGIWGACSYASSLCSRYIHQFKWQWADDIEWPTDLVVDNKRSWCMCSIGTSSQINTRNSCIIKAPHLINDYTRNVPNALTAHNHKTAKLQTLHTIEKVMEKRDEENRSSYFAIDYLFK